MNKRRHRVRPDKSAGLVQEDLLYRAFFDLSPCGILLEDQQGTILDANEALCRDTGYSRKELLGRNVRLFVPPGQIALVDMHLATVASKGNFEHEVLNIRKDGSLRTVRLREAAIQLPDGRQGVLVMAEDITERKQAEQALRESHEQLELRVRERTAELQAINLALRESEEKYRLLYDSMRDAFVQVDMQGRIQFCNRAYEELLGYSQEELTRLTYLNITPIKWHACEQEIVTSQILPLGHSKVYEKEYRRKNGEVFPVELLTSVVRDKTGSVVGMMAIVRDISERKQAEARLTKLSTDLLRSEDQERRRIARELHDSVAQQLVGQLLSLTQLKKKLAHADESIRTLADESLDIFKQCLREVRTISFLLHPPHLKELGLVEAVRYYAREFGRRSGIEIREDISSRVDLLPEEQELTLYRVLQEALSNVHRHSASPTAQVRLVFTPRFVRLEIKDAGKGIPVKDVTSKFQSSYGVGIPGMQERLRNLGGSLKILPAHPGTRVVATIPRAVVPLPGRKSKKSA
ncbi:MAG: PAS domain S-box protein [Verrucomicrobiota bacterium]